MRLALVKINLIASVLLLEGALTAQELPEFFLGVRPMGMGGAFTALANDENSPWTNPAGIARIRKNRSRSGLHLLKFPNVIAGANADGREAYTGLQASQEKNVQTVVESTESLGDAPIWARAATTPQLFFDMGRGNPMSLTTFSNVRGKAFIDKDDPATTQISAIADIGGLLGFAWQNRTNRFNIGFQIRPMYRYAYEDNVPTVDLTEKKLMQDRLENDSNFSTAIAADAGFMFTMADFWFPTIAGAVFNAPTGCKEDYLNPFSETRQTVCGTVYQGEFGNPDAISTVDPVDFRVGVSITPRLTRKLALRLAVDGHHLYTSSGDTHYGLSDVEPLKTIHAGAELFVGNPLMINPLSVRIGSSQGFMTAGGSIRMGFLSLDVATYGTDVSTSETAIEDRRYIGAVSFDF